MSYFIGRCEALIKLGFPESAMRYLLPAGIGAAGGALIGGPDNRLGGALGGAALGAGAGHFMTPGAGTVGKTVGEADKRVAENMQRSMARGPQAAPAQTAVSENMQRSMARGPQAAPAAAIPKAAPRPIPTAARETVLPPPAMQAAPAAEIPKAAPAAAIPKAAPETAPIGRRMVNSQEVPALEPTAPEMAPIGRRMVNPQEVPALEPARIPREFTQQVPSTARVPQSAPDVAIPQVTAARPMPPGLRKTVVLPPAMQSAPGVAVPQPTTRLTPTAARKTVLMPPAMQSAPDVAIPQVTAARIPAFSEWPPLRSFSESPSYAPGI